MRFHILLTIVLLFMFIAFPAHSQIIEDAMRLVDNPSTVGGRALGMGNAFVGVADDFSALYWNPAGLGLMRRPELYAGLTSYSMNNDATYLGSATSGKTSATFLNGLGFALPFPVVRGSMVIALGYNRVNNFHNVLDFSSVNPTSSIIPKLYDVDERYDLAWHLNMEDTTSAIPMTNGLTQAGSTIESGGLNNWSLGGSLEVMRNLLVGVTLTISSGSYQWDRTLSEADLGKLYQGLIAGKRDATDFREFILDESLDQDFSGFYATLGFLYNWNDRARLGLTVKTPTQMTMKESYYSSGESIFASGSFTWDGDPMINYDNKEYVITTPWQISIGGAYMPIEYITLAASATMTDYTSLEFDANEAPTTDDQKYFKGLNKRIREDLRATTNFNVGAEFTIPQTGLQLRGGFGYRPSPYLEDEGKSQYDTKTFTVGLGYLFDDGLLLNVTYAQSSAETFHSQEPFIADYTYRTDEKLSGKFLMCSLAFRF